jgi:drug/metabolite transporter (DMT)-like permease
MYAATSWGYRHPHVSAGVRIAAGTWNLILGVFFLIRGYQWGAALLVVSALIFCAAYVLGRGKFESRRNGRR